MASIPILAAVAAAIIVPVAGTGIYYSVRPSNQETSKQQKSEEISRLPERRTQIPRTDVREGMMSHHTGGTGFVDIQGTTFSSLGGSSRLQGGRIRNQGETFEQFEGRTHQEGDEAKANIDELLKNVGSLDLDSNFPSAFDTIRTSGWASPKSSSSLRRP